MNQKWIAGALLGAVLALSACQTNMPEQTHHASTTPVRQSIAVDRSMVYSYHLGTDAHAQSYLLIVLNDRGVQVLNLAAQRGQPYDITLDGLSFAQTAQVNSGFLVLNPASATWTEQRLESLLK